jgi:hypothetical protein
VIDPVGLIVRCGLTITLWKSLFSSTILMFWIPPERHCLTRNSSSFSLAPGQVGSSVLGEIKSFAASPGKFSERDGMELQPFESRKRKRALEISKPAIYRVLRPMGKASVEPSVRPPSRVLPRT